MALILCSVLILVLGLWFLRLQGKQNAKGSYPNLTLVGKEGDELVLDYSSLKSLSSTSGRVRSQNKLGNWGNTEAFRGVPMEVLVEMVGGMNPGDELRVTSHDGYYQDYTYYNVYPDLDLLSIQGQFIMACVSDEEEIPKWSHGPRTIFLAPDEEFSNTDAMYTSGIGQGYFSNPSAGGRSVRNAWKVEVRPGRSPGEEWVLSMIGSTSKNLSRTEFETLGHGLRRNVTDPQGNLWEGVPLWRLLGLIDGDPRRGDDSFNNSYAQLGYEVRLQGNSEFSLRSQEVAQNDAMVVADRLNGSSLAQHPALASPDWSVEGLHRLQFFPLWVVRVEGEEIRELFYSELLNLGSVRGYGGYLKTTGAVVGPYDANGIPLLSVLQVAGDIPQNFSLEIRAVDGYTITLTEEQVRGQVDVYDLAGNKVGFGGVTAVLIYEQNGSRDFSGQPFRLAYLGEGDDFVTDSHFWTKEVIGLRIKKAIKDWTVELVGLTRYLLNRTTFESAATCERHRAAVNLTSRNVTSLYEGLPLWVAISIIDGKEDPEGHYFFNDDLAREGYQVLITASDGFTATIESSLVWRNDRIILAHLKDGEVLEDGWPLRVVGEGLTSKQSIKGVSRIELVLPQKG